MKILLDTNVLIAAFISHGVCSELFEHCAQHHILLTSDFILGEFRQILTGKLKYTSDETEEAVELLLSRTSVVSPTALEESVCRDPDDDNVLATAIAGMAECIITADKDLLELQKHRGIDIISPAASRDYETSKS